MRRSGFALIEILISVTILSMVLLSVGSGVLSCIYVISENRNYTRAMIIARSKMNDFILEKMRGLDLDNEPIQDSPGFYFSRKTGPYQHPMIPFQIKKTDITVTWNLDRKKVPYKISYIYAQ